MKPDRTIFLTMLMLGVVAAFIPVKTGNAGSGASQQMIREARILAEREGQLFQARNKLDWKSLHALQHPEFRKKVSVVELKFFEGWVTADYREKAKQRAHISGAAVPSLDFMKKHPHKFDPLGYPTPRRYKWSGDPFLKIKTYSLEKISISRDGRYARVQIMAQGRQRLNPVMIRGNIQFDAQYPLTDYWEKVDGNWVITLLAKPISICGAGKLIHYLPNDNSGWGKMEFIDIDPEDLNLS